MFSKHVSYVKTVEAYKKGIMKGGAAIPPPGNLNLPGSMLSCLYFNKASQ
jgi:hypothetical protein